MEREALPAVLEVLPRDLLFDPWADRLGDAFDAAGISWGLIGVEYEEESGFYHWSWDWEVV